MNGAVIRKTARDALLIFGIMLVAIFIFEILLVFAYGELSSEIGPMLLKNAMIRRMISTLVGADLGLEPTPTAMLSVGMAHPLLWAFTWTFLLAVCTRAIAGEMERGTADLLLTLPVSRRAVYVSATVVWVAAGIPLCLAPLGGAWTGNQLRPLWGPVEFDRLAMVIVNLFFLYVNIGCGAMLASTLIGRRGPAIGLVLGLLLFSFLLNFLAQFWSVAGDLDFLGVLYYYQPLPIVRDGTWPVRDMCVLGGFAALFWTAGLIHFTRRDIPAA